MSRVFANGPENRDQFQVESYQKIVLDAALLNTQHYKWRIKGKVKQSREMSSALLYTWSPSTKVANFTYEYFDLSCG